MSVFSPGRRAPTARLGKTRKKDGDLVAIEAAKECGWAAGLTTVCLLGIQRPRAGPWRRDHSKQQRFPGTGGGRAEGGHRSEVRSLQVSAGGGDEVVQG